MEKTKFLIVKGLDGLGSNIKMLYSCLYYANKYNIKILIDWRFYNFYKNNDLFNSLFENKNLELITDNFSSKSYFPSYWNDSNIHLKKKIPCQITKKLVVSNHDFEKNINKYETIVAISKFFIAKLDSYVLENDLVLKPSNIISKKINDYYDKNLKNKFKICIHYRHGNGELNGRRNINLQNLYIQKINNTINNIKDKEYIIFLCTDSKEIQDFFKNFYNDKCKFIDKWFPDKNLGPLHYNGYCLDKYKSIEDSIIDLYILSTYDYLICGHSHFSNQAILISKSKNKIEKPFYKINNTLK